MPVNSHCFAAYKTRPCLALSHLPLKLSSTLKFQLIYMQVGSTRMPQGKSSLFFLALYRAAGLLITEPHASHKDRRSASLKQQRPVARAQQQWENKVWNKKVKPCEQITAWTCMTPYTSLCADDQCWNKIGYKGRALCRPKDGGGICTQLCRI